MWGNEEKFVERFTEMDKQRLFIWPIVLILQVRIYLSFSWRSSFLRFIVRQSVNDPPPRQLVFYFSEPVHKILKYNFNNKGKYDINFRVIIFFEFCLAKCILWVFEQRIKSSSDFQIQIQTFFQFLYLKNYIQQTLTESQHTLTYIELIYNTFNLILAKT